jgi:hypothetical protein
MENNTLELRRAALALMDAADLLEEGDVAEARIRVQVVIEQLGEVIGSASAGRQERTGQAEGYGDWLNADRSPHPVHGPTLAELLKAGR